MVNRCRLQITALVARQGSGVRHHPDPCIGAVQGLQLRDGRLLGLDGSQGLPIYQLLVIGDKPPARGGRDCKNISGRLNLPGYIVKPSVKHTI